jgi:sugar phosphate isomerase/epimerase
MIVKAVQQLMLGKLLKNEEQAAGLLRSVHFSGYDGIELNGYMIRPTSPIVRALTAAAGMPAGRGGAFDWPELTRKAGMKVVSLHTDLGSLQKSFDETVQTAKSLATDKIVITGMYRFDYTDAAALKGLCADLNRMGEALRAEGLALLYHNHNVELCRQKDSGERAYDVLIRQTDPDVVGFEFDSYWFIDGGADAVAWMEKLGKRMRLWHINDRGTRFRKTPLTPIVKADSMELGYGSIALDRLTAAAKANGIDAVVLETHRNHIDGDPLKSIQRSAAYLNSNF